MLHSGDIRMRIVPGVARAPWNGRITLPRGAEFAYIQRVTGHLHRLNKTVVDECMDTETTQL